VCILSHANWFETERALTSAWAQGLHVHLGVTVDADCPFSHPLLSVYSCPWTDDFSAVRNRLLDQIVSEIPYFLWLDSDEEIVCCPSLPPTDPDIPLFTVRISTQAGLTSAKRTSLHRNLPNIRWTGAIHERLTVLPRPTIPERPLLPGIALVHHGYEDRANEVAKLGRNSKIAVDALASGDAHPGSTASIARDNAALGQATAFDWLAVFRTAEAFAQTEGGSNDLIYEPAAALAYCGYTRPAEQLAAENPLNMPLQISLLAAHYAKTGTQDHSRFAQVLTCLQRILWDDRFAFDAKLIDTTPDALSRYIMDQADGLGWDRGSPTSKGHAMNTQTLYTQCPDILLETFEDDALLLSPQTNRVVSLNPSGSVFWDALADKTSVDDCAAMIAEATGTPVTPADVSQITAFFQNLIENGMIETA
ncbi:unnamed protein product, partial [Hapterophycus canaliculatus]